MLSRTSHVETVSLKSVLFSSVFQIGDTSFIDGSTKALAVQREKDIFFGTEGNFNDYPVFSYPTVFIPINENMILMKNNQNPLIKVRNIDVLAVSFSSILGIGNANSVRMQSRIKHIRQLDIRNHNSENKEV
ncbi:spore germination protein GerPE [Peribacillus tepidiphilus]|uniref:spore germination protein GerPE n=1 Tax=Peribacillus tepidiphilus TaxID=2652445 RepID=UPI0035B511BF